MLGFLVTATLHCVSAGHISLAAVRLWYPNLPTAAEAARQLRSGSFDRSKAERCNYEQVQIQIAEAGLQ